MIAQISLPKKQVKVDLSQPIDISIPLKNGENNPLAWYIDAPKIEPAQLDDWIGSVKKGASVNFNNIYFNPHAHGTHTECLGHITKDFFSVNQQLKNYFFETKLVSCSPDALGEDLVISESHLQKVLQPKEATALVLRTLPNDSVKKSKNYNSTNWPYLTEAAAIYLVDCGIEHLLIDLPSVDKENDGGKLLAHNAFWQMNEAEKRTNATITEMIFVDSQIEDGQYLLNLQVAPFENDASPSRPVLYRIENL